MNTMTTSNSIRSMYRLFAAIVLIAMCVPATFAGELEQHNPYTVYGMRLRSHLIPETPGATDELGPLVFQEIVPCRFVSTLAEDKYDNPWGGKEYQIQETRTYYPKGLLVSSNNWENPCSLHVPIDAVAVSLRLTSIEPEQGTNIYLAPATYSTHAQQGMWFAGGHNEMKEANVVLKNDGFSMTTDQVSHLTIDVIGFFLRDPMGSGAKGDKGDKGDQGERGESGAQGLSGAKGEKGDNGTAGAQGLQGERGDRGESGAQGLSGAKGDKGERGESGAQGLGGEKGEKGDNGTAGAQGLKGDKGDNGTAGAQGSKGDKGEKGDNGTAGAQGFKGDKGEKGDNGTAGAQGLKGDKGERGDRGTQGERGTTGVTGAQGPAGPQGATGPQGVKGDKGDANVGFVASAGGPYTFPPGGNITIYDSDVTANSFIVLTYVEVSNGNALGIASQSKGSFVATGSPNKPFKYLVVTMK